MEAAGSAWLRINSLDSGEAVDARARGAGSVEAGAQKSLSIFAVLPAGEPGRVTVATFSFATDNAKTIGREQKVLKSFEADPKVTVFSGPVVVLIDAGNGRGGGNGCLAFLEDKRGDVVGEKSFGAGAEQELFTLRER